MHFLFVGHANRFINGGLHAQRDAFKEIDKTRQGIGAAIEN